MSVRTRENRMTKPGVAAIDRPARLDRKAEHRKVRRAVHTELNHLDEPEDHALPKPVHTARKVDPSEKPQAADVSRRRFKVWKTKGWKRRTAQRAERAAAYDALRKEN